MAKQREEARLKAEAKEAERRGKEEGQGQEAADDESDEPEYE